jgi:hypothetical protein
MDERPQGPILAPAARHRVASFFFSNAPHRLRVLAEMSSRDFQERLPSFLLG